MLDTCVLCGGVINPGEPVKMTADGLCHYFKTTCEWELEQRENAELLKTSKFTM